MEKTYTSPIAELTARLKATRIALGRNRDASDAAVSQSRNAREIRLGHPK